MIAGVATETIVESTRIMKNPRQSANSAGHGSFCSTAGAVVVGVVTDQLNTLGGGVLPAARKIPLATRVGG